MYPSNAVELSQSHQYSGNAGQTSAEKCLPPGVASRIGDLQKIVAALQDQTYKTKAALGLTSAPSDIGNKQPPSTLAEVLGDLHYRIDCAIQDLTDVCQHLNS